MYAVTVAIRDEMSRDYMSRD